MEDLKTTYQDDILDTTKNTKRKFNMIQNEDGTVSFEDVTTYSQVGDSFGATDVNAITETVNELNSDIENSVHIVLWENSDCSSDFAEKAITIHKDEISNILMDYEYFAIEYFSSTTSFSPHRIYTTTGREATMEVFSRSGSTALVNRRRTVQINPLSLTSGAIAVSFSECTSLVCTKTNSDSNKETTNDKIIPYRIMAVPTKKGY